MTERDITLSLEMEARVDAEERAANTVEAVLDYLRLIEGGETPADATRMATLSRPDVDAELVDAMHRFNPPTKGVSKSKPKRRK